MKKFALLLALIIATLFMLGCVTMVGLTIWAVTSDDETVVTPWPPYSVSNLGTNFEKLWEISNTPGTRTTNSSNLAVSHGMVYFITEGPEEASATILSLTAFDALSGEVIWQNDGEFWPGLFYNSTFLYAIIDGNHIIVYEPETGERVWGTKLQGVRGVSHVTATETELFIDGVPDKFFILDATTGRELRAAPSSGGMGYTAFLIENDTAYWHEWPLRLVSTNLQTEERNWSQTFEGRRFEKTPIFTDELIFVVSFWGQLFALDKETGEILWQTAPLNSLTDAERVVSNVAVADGIVYYLTQDSQLRALNMYTGELLGVVKFTPSLFALDTDIVNDRFDVAADGDLVAVYFGSSYQIFTFRFLPDE